MDDSVYDRPCGQEIPPPVSKPRRLFPTISAGTGSEEAPDPGRKSRRERPRRHMSHRKWNRFCAALRARRRRKRMAEGLIQG